MKVIVIVLMLLMAVQSCVKSNGGSTAGNPLDSSLPQTISTDAG